MLYLSAQPSEFYFIWQIEVFITNFNQIGIKKDRIHILLTETTDKDFEELYKNYSDRACFFFYKDERSKGINYAPTIRPHLIKKHFDKIPDLENQTIFYHDADIIFREQIDIKKVNDKQKWFVSNTKSYIGIDFLNDRGPTIINDLCKIVGIPISLAYKNADAFGGAQYILNGTHYSFWEKHEMDSEIIFNFLRSNKEIYENYFFQTASSKKTKDTKNLDSVQEWCADMWSMILNGLYFQNKIEISEELNFCWPNNDIDAWSNCKILHNAGVNYKDFDKLFYKSKYINFSPFDDIDFHQYHFDFTKCTKKYVEAIKKVDRRLKLNNITFLIISENNDSPIVQIFSNFLEKNFKEFSIHVISEISLRQNNINDILKKIFTKGNSMKNNNLTIVTNGMIYFDKDLFFNSLHVFQECEEMMLLVPYLGLKMVINEYAKSLFVNRLDTNCIRDLDCTKYTFLTPQCFFIKINEEFIKKVSETAIDDFFDINNWFDIGVKTYKHVNSLNQSFLHIEYS